MSYKLSIILPTYNSGRTLQSCIDTLNANLSDHSDEEYEVLVPDRSSSDNTIEILNKYPDFKVISHSLAGISSAYNIGVENAKGDFILFLNSDDELGAGYLKKMLDIAYTKNPAKHVVYSSVLFIDSNNTELYYRHPAPYISSLQKYYSVILHPNALYPANLIRKYPFEVLPGNPPRDREHVYKLMKDAIWTRTSEVHYRYRIWSSSGTVQLAKTKTNRSLKERMIILLGRVYIQSFETSLFKRLVSKRTGSQSYWKSPN